MDFLRAVAERVAARGRRAWFWADVVLHHPTVLARLPGDVVACAWGYEATHDFDGELARLAESDVARVACPIASRAASMTASDSVGWAWMVWPTSSTVASKVLPRANSAISSVASAPMMCAPSSAPVLASKMVLTRPSVSPSAIALPLAA